MTYKVTYSETLRGDYIIEADSEQEAVDKLYKLMEEEQIDTLDLDIVCSNTTAVEIKRSSELMGRQTNAKKM